MTGFHRRIIIPVSLSEVFNFYWNSCSFFLMAYLNFWSFCICNLNNDFSYISWTFGNYMELTLYFLICVIYCEIGLLLIDIVVIKYLAIEKTGVFRVRIIYIYNYWFLLKYCSFLLVVLLS